VRAWLWERVWVQAWLLELALVYGRLAQAAGRQLRVRRRLERAARRAQTEEHLYFIDEKKKKMGARK
jgi:hypothetical protein